MNASKKTAIHVTPVSGYMNNYWLVEFSDETIHVFDNEDEAFGVFGYVEN